MVGIDLGLMRVQITHATVNRITIAKHLKTFGQDCGPVHIIEVLVTDAETGAACSRLFADQFSNSLLRVRFKRTLVLMKVVGMVDCGFKCFVVR